MSKIRRMAVTLTAIAIALSMLSVVAVNGAGIGKFVVSIIGVGQQGGLVVSGACQGGATVTVETDDVYVGDASGGTFVINALMFTGIDPSCESGVLAVNGGPGVTSFEPSGGTALVELSPTIPVGDLDSLALLLK